MRLIISDIPQKRQNTEFKTNTGRRSSRPQLERDLIMIFIETNRIYSIYVRKSGRTKWINAMYGGRYATIEEAIERAKKEMGTTPFEYIVEDLSGEVIATGFENCKK